MDVFDVIIVGAGVSGLVAAYELQKKGLNVKILEVANEPGGRMRSDFYSGISSPIISGGVLFIYF